MVMLEHGTTGDFLILSLSLNTNFAKTLQHILGLSNSDMEDPHRRKSHSLAKIVAGASHNYVT